MPCLSAASCHAFWRSVVCGTNVVAHDVNRPPCFLHFLRQPKVCNLQDAVWEHDHVSRFEIAMDDELPVKKGYCLGRLKCHFPLQNCSWVTRAKIMPQGHTAKLYQHSQRGHTGNKGVCGQDICVHEPLQHLQFMHQFLCCPWPIGNFQSIQPVFRHATHHVNSTVTARAQLLKPQEFATLNLEVESFCIYFLATIFLRLCAIHLHCRIATGSDQCCLCCLASETKELHRLLSNLDSAIWRNCCQDTAVLAAASFASFWKTAFCSDPNLFHLALAIASVSCPRECSALKNKAKALGGRCNPKDLFLT